VIALAACSSSARPAAETTTTTTTTTTVADTTTTTATTAPRVPWAAIPNDGVARAVITPNGFILPVRSSGADVYVVQTPCDGEATTTGTRLTGANVVLDPGHGGIDPGAVGPSGLREKDINLDVAQQTKRILEAAGAVVVLTRDRDQNTTLATRDALAVALDPQAYISIHHNAEPDGPTGGPPGHETYYQIANPSSKRLAGILWEELDRAFSAYGIAWMGDTDHGAKYRPGSRGDYYAVLRQTEGIDAVLSEAAFISNPPEEALLATPEFRLVEAQAIAAAIIRFVSTDDTGSGFVEPYPRTEPAGGGGTSAGCDDPVL
jgi:N-acetylmuramoyl-L-alanine amidase